VADYSQIELRVAAFIAGEKVMIDAFKRGEDLHRSMAKVNQGKDPMAVTKSERALGKVTNFGFLYGQSAKGFSLYARKDYGLILSVRG
jgi:DNA polymerase I-like protein with 3'-5' exonuclease and polymerase domains